MSMEKIMAERLQALLEDTRQYVLRDQADLPAPFRAEIEEEHKAIQEGDMTIRNPGLRDYFQGYDTCQYWVSTSVEGVSVSDGEVPKSRLDVVKGLFRVPTH